jgi:hypothetical protein
LLGREKSFDFGKLLQAKSGVLKLTIYFGKGEKRINKKEWLNRKQILTLTVFIAIIGGIIAFGTTGIVLGPLVLAVTISLIDIWKKRIGAGEPLTEEPAAEES